MRNLPLYIPILLSIFNTNLHAQTPVKIAQDGKGASTFQQIRCLAKNYMLMEIAG